MPPRSSWRARSPQGFTRVADSAAILAQVNAVGLNYAPSISRDGLELFFTRIADRANPSPEIFRAARATTAAPFGAPQRVAAISGSAEAPALSPDGRVLYYHKRENGRFSIFLSAVRWLMTNQSPNRSRSIAGRVALITGAASGMGRATAKLFAAEGAHVAVTDLDLAACENVAAECGANARAYALDVADGDAIARTVAQIAADFGRIDILVNNAGVSSFCALDDPAYEDVWHRALAVMLTAHQRMVRAALPWLRQSDAARIVNIASTEGLGATPGDTPYVAAKTGVIGLTRGLAVDLGPEGITVNCICPGPIRTAMTDAVAEEHKAIFAKRRTALRRYGEPEEVAHITLSLVLPAASYITGVAIPVDGGLMARNA